MNMLAFVLLFIFSAPPLIQAEERKGDGMIHEADDVLLSEAVDALDESVADPIRYFGKFYVRQETRGAGSLADDDCEVDGEHLGTLPNRTKFGYAWQERFCLEGNFQLQSEGSTKYGIQAVIRF